MPRPSSVSPAFDMQLLCVGLLMAWVVASQYINCKPVLVIHFFHSVLSAVWLWGYRFCGLQLVCGSWKRSQRFRPRPSTQKALVSFSECPEHIVYHYHASVILYGRLSVFILVAPLCVPAVGYLLPFVPLQVFMSLDSSSWLPVPLDSRSHCSLCNLRSGFTFRFISACRENGFALVAARAGLREAPEEEPILSAPLTPRNPPKTEFIQGCKARPGEKQRACSCCCMRA